MLSYYSLKIFKNIAGKNPEVAKKKKKKKKKKIKQTKEKYKIKQKGKIISFYQNLQCLIVKSRNL